MSWNFKTDLILWLYIIHTAVVIVVYNEVSKLSALKSRSEKTIFARLSVNILCEKIR